MSNISALAKKTDKVVPIGSFGGLTTSSRYSKARRDVTAHPRIQRIVGDSLGGGVALHLKTNHPELMSKTYGTLLLYIG